MTLGGEYGHSFLAFGIPAASHSHGLIFILHFIPIIPFSTSSHCGIPIPSHSHSHRQCETAMHSIDYQTLYKLL